MTHSIITITGHLGSGKSTVAKMLAEQLHWQYYSTGMALRLIAQKRGVSAVELNHMAVTDPSIDAEVDSVFQNPPWGKNPCVVDSRLAFHFIPDSLKVCLQVDTKVAAERIWAEKGRLSEHYTSLEEARTYLEKRYEWEKIRYMKTYHVDVTNLGLFDLVINTTDLTPDQVCEKVLAAL